MTRLSKVDPAEGSNPRDTKTFLLLSGPNHNLFGSRDPKAYVNLNSICLGCCSTSVD